MLLFSFFLNANYQKYKFDEKLEDLGKHTHIHINITSLLHHHVFLNLYRYSCIQKHGYTVKTIDDDDFMILTIVRTSNYRLVLQNYKQGRII